MAIKVGLTGGIGSGKSTVSKMFETLGVFTIDADSIAKELSQPGTREYTQIIDYFGPDIVGPLMKINRSKLAKMVFSNGHHRKALEAILHPPIRTLMLQRCEQSGSPYCILEIPLLIETGQYREMDRVIVVTSKPEIRMHRLEQDRKMSRKSIHRILDSQLSDQQRIENANDIVTNDGTIAALKTKVVKLHKNYVDMFDL